jgi:hypothetical protein
MTGDFFNVKVGKPEALKVLREPVSTWAGNQPFKVQPKVALVDAGGNTLSHVSNVDVETIVVKSLSQSSDIIIDTQNDDVPKVERIVYSPAIVEDGLSAYSNGYNISIHVIFNQEVFVSPLTPQDLDQGLLVRPSLTLNVTDEEGKHGRAYLVEPINTDEPNQYLTFVYEVRVGVAQSTVDVLDGDALKSNDYIITDAWERNVSLSIPLQDQTNNLVSSKDFVVHNQPAAIMKVSAMNEDGTYGAGQEIDFVVEFTHEVRL